MDVRLFLDSSKPTEIAKKIAELATSTEQGSIDILADFLIYRDRGTYDKHVIPQLASRALLCRGPVGVSKLLEIFDIIDGSIYPQAIIESLWYASHGRYPKLNFDFYTVYPPLDQPLNQDTRDAAKDAIYSLIISSQTNPETFFRMVWFMQSSTFRFAGNEKEFSDFQKQFFSILSDSTIKITMKTINQFAELIDKETKEEEYQAFFEMNPVFIDPLASRVVDKHRLGDDYITDFVLETLKGEYILLEIEKPQDNIFNKKGDFSGNFTHAFGQVIDFINWIEQNIAYANKKLPGVSCPRGLLIMGRSKGMSESNLDKLKRFNKNSNSVEVLTYDDVLSRALSLYKNLRKQ